MQRRTATWTGGRVADSMLCRAVPEAVEPEDERSKSEMEKAEEDEDDEAEDIEDEDAEGLPVYGTVEGRVAEADIVTARCF